MSVPSAGKRFLYYHGNFSEIGDGELEAFLSGISSLFDLQTVDAEGLRVALKDGSFVLLLSDIPLSLKEKFVEFLSSGGVALAISPLPFVSYLDDSGSAVRRVDFFQEITGLAGWYDFKEARLSKPTGWGRKYGFFFPVTNWNAAFSEGDFSPRKGLYPLLASESGSVAAFARKVGRGLLVHAGNPYFTNLEFLLNVYSFMHVLFEGKVPPLVRKAMNDFPAVLTKFISEGVRGILNEAVPHSSQASDFGKRPSGPSVVFLAQSHLDFSWLWNYDRTIEKMKLTSLRALKNIYRHSKNGFKMNMTSPAFYWFMENYAPSVFKEIKRRIQEGKWDPVTGDWVEHDCNVVSGESMVRQRLHGQRYLRSRFGFTSAISWMPDTFGFPLQMPQVLAKSAQKYFFTNKLDWGDEYKFPLRVFEWASPDGSSVLAVNLPPKWGCAAFAPFHSSEFAKYAVGSQIFRDKKVFSCAEDLNLPQNPEDHVSFYPVLVGEGDGGAGPSEDLLEAAFRYVESSDAVRGFYTAGEFFRMLEKEVASKQGSLALWKDELYLPYHRGTYTSQWWIKSLNRRAETSLFRSEFLSLMLEKIFKEPYPGSILDRAWKEFMLYQFHDPLPGSAIREVYEEARKNIPEHVFSVEERLYRKIATLGDAGRESGAKTAAVKAHSSSLKAVFNPAPYSGAFPVEKGCGEVAVARFDGSGFYRFASVVESASKIWSSHDAGRRAVIENEFYRVEVEDGSLVSIKDLRNDMELLSSPVEVVAYSDKPRYWDNWEISPDYTTHPKAHFVSSKIKVSFGKNFSEVLMEGSLDGSPFRWKIKLFRGLPFIENDIWTDWKSSRTVVKLWLNSVFSGDKVVSSTQFGHYVRPFEPRSAYEKSKWEYPHQEWEAIANDRGAFYVVNDSLYGSGIKDGKWGLTLLKAGNSPDPEADLYEHSWRILFYHSMGDWKEGKPWVVSSFLNLKPRIIELSPKVARRVLDRPLLRVSDDVVVSAFKKWEDGEGLVLRLFSPTGEAVDAEISLGLLKEIKAVKELNLIEDVISDSPEGVEIEGNALKVSLAPWEIRTLLII